MKPSPISPPSHYLSLQPDLNHDRLFSPNNKGQLTYEIHEVLSIRGRIKPLENGHENEANTSSPCRGPEVGEWRQSRMCVFHNWWVSWFMTRFASRRAHGCDEQWNARDTRVYIGSSLSEDNSPTSCVHRLYYDCLGRYPLYPSFYRLRRVRSITVVPDLDSISTYPIYKISFYNYLLNCLGYGLPGQCS
jgi:hypothetical protein